MVNHQVKTHPGRSTAWCLASHPAPTALGGFFTTNLLHGSSDREEQEETKGFLNIVLLGRDGTLEHWFVELVLGFVLFFLVFMCWSVSG